MTTGAIINDVFMLALLLIGVPLALKSVELRREQREEKRRQDARNRVVDEKEKWDKLNKQRADRVERDIMEQRAAAKEIADGKAPLDGPFVDIDRFFSESVELRGIGLGGLHDDSLRMIARYVSEYREEYLYPLLENEIQLHEAFFELEFDLVLDGPGRVASTKAAIRSLTDEIAGSRKRLHSGLQQLRYNIREVSARHRGVPVEKALKDADDARAKEPEVYSWLERLIYRGGYVDVPRNELVY